MKVIQQIAEIFYDGFQKLLEGDGMLKNSCWSCEAPTHVQEFHNLICDIVFIIVRQCLW